LDYRGYLTPEVDAGLTATGSAPQVSLGVNGGGYGGNTGAASMFTCPAGAGGAAAPGGTGTATDFYVVDIGAVRASGGTLTVSTCGGGTEFDTVVAIGASCNAGGPTTSTYACAASNDDGCGAASVAVLSPAIGRYYQVAVWGYDTSVSGAYRLTWRYDDPVTPTRSSSTSASPSSAATTTSTPASTPSSSGTAPITPSNTPSSSGTPLPICGGFTGFRPALYGMSGSTPARNLASPLVLSPGYNCPAVSDNSANQPADFYVLDLGVST
jgi:hypothetical protein